MNLRMRRVFFAVVAALVALFSSVGQLPGQVFASSGNANLHLTKTVGTATLTPQLALTLSVDKPSAIPGDTLTYTATLSNTGATLRATGTYTAQNTGATTATVLSYFDAVSTASNSHCGTTLTNQGNNTSQWTPLAGTAQALAGYTPVVPSPIVGSMTLSVTPVAASGVTYPSSGDQILGTVMQAGATASWTYVATLQLTPQQVGAVLDPQVDHIRNTLHAEMGQRTQQGNGQPASVDTDFCQQLANSAPSGAATNATVTITPQGFGSALTFSSSTTPVLASIPSGGSVQVSGTAAVPVPAAKSGTETDSQYVARLDGIEGSTLHAVATATASSSGGQISPPQATSPSTTVHLPIMGIVKSGPANADAGTTATYPLALSNTGGATASGIAIADTVPSGDTGTVSGIPSTLAAGGTASAQATYAIPATQGPGPLTDTASLTWHDANNNAYGPVSGLYTTNVTSSLAGAHLTITPTAAGPNPTGSTQSFTATLVDVNNVPLGNRSIDFAVTGVNPQTGFATTDSNGVAHFSYSGSNDGTDTVQASATQGSVTVSSDTATVGWITPITEISTTTVQGNFYREATTTTSFVAKPTDQPDFGQTFPTINFDPPAKTVNGMPAGLVDPTTRPFTDVTTDALGNFNGTIVAQGNSIQAGRGVETAFDAVFNASFVVDKPGDVTFNIVADDGFMLGIGGGATRVNGTYEGAPASNQSAFNGYPLVGAWNQQGGSAPQTFPVTVHFPAPGTYPYEIDYFECCSSDLSLTMTVAKVIQDTSPISVYVGYADGLRPAGSIFPFPWVGSPNVVFEGCQVNCQYDAGAIRVDNSGTTAVTVNHISVSFGSVCTYQIWPDNQTLPAGDIMMFTQTVSGATSGCSNDGRFDTSDLPYAGFCGQNGLIPQISLTIDGATTTYTDSAQVLDTGGRDTASCPGQNESEAWSRIGGGGTTINVPLPPAVTLALAPALVNGAVVGSTQSFTVTVLDGSGQPVAALPVSLGVFGANTQQLNGTTDAAGHVQFSYSGGNAGTDTLTATAFVSGLRAVSNAGSISWAIPAPTSGGTGTTGSSSGTGPPAISGLTPVGGSVIASPTPVHATVTAPSGGSISSWSVSLQDVTGGTPITVASGSGAPPSTLATIDPSALGSATYTLTVSATSAAGGTASLSDTISTGAGGGTTAQAPPTITPPSPPDGSVITKPVPITASFTAPAGQTIASWKVTYQALDPEPAITLASGTGTPPATLATFDPTVLPNDTYAITVSATASGGGTQSSTSTVAVTGNLKLGRYVASYQDLNVPVNGFQMQVKRSYDSYDKRVGDFGVGWKVSLANFRTSSNRQLGAGGWSEQPTSCFFGLCFYGFTTSAPHYVTVTWPDGHQEQFDFTPQGGGILFYWQGTAAFTAHPGTGTTSTLAVDGDNSLNYGFDGNLYDSNFDIFNPTRFVLTTRDGRVLHLDTSLGLISESDPSGNTLNVDSTGVHASNGQSITYTRDSLGRITQITGPAGQTLTYAYSAAGDLSTFTDPDGRVIDYTYDGNHNILSIAGNGLPPQSTLQYDSTGRLVSVTDGSGNVTQISNNVGAQQQTVTDPLGKRTTISTLDDRGDVIQVDDIADGKDLVTTSTYDSVGRQTSTTDPSGDTFKATYDASGDLLSYTDANGRSLAITYATNGSPLTGTSPTGAVTTFAYDTTGNLTSMTDALGHSASFHYDGAGHELSDTNFVGGVTSYTYDGSGRQTTRTDPLGRVTSYAYDGSNNVTAVTDGLGNKVQATYDNDGHLTSVTDALGHVTSWTYDGLGRTVSKTDALGQKTAYTYDAAGRLASVTDPAGHVTSNGYDADGNVTSVTDATGAVTHSAYDGHGRLTSQTDALGHTTTYAYDSAGRLVSRTLPTGGTFTYAYDGDGHRLSQTDPHGNTTTYAYDPGGRLLKQTDPNGGVHTFTYDAAGNLSASTDALGHTTSYGYDNAGNLISSTDPLGDVTQHAYDTAGQLTQDVDATGRATTYGYDAAGQLSTVTDNAGHVTTLHYDAAGRPTGATLPSGIASTATFDNADRITGVTDALGHTTAYAYDAAGNRTSVTDALGHTTAYAYDAVGRQTSITDPLGGKATFAYDAAGHLTSSTDPDGHVTTQTYDALGDLLSRTDPSGHSTTSTYDNTGRLATRTNARGDVAAYGYDAMSHLVSVQHPGGTDTFAYDLAGRNTSFGSAVGTTALSYDNADRLTSAASPQGTVGYAYDAAGRRTSLSLPGGHSATYAYDAAGLLASLTDSSNAVTTLTRDADGRITGIARPNGVSTAYTYDGAGRMTGIKDTASGGAVLAQFGYTLDANGNRTAETSTAGTTSYTLDAAQRLTGVTYPDGTSAAYTYDAAGNRLSQTTPSGTTAYTYNAAGQLTSAGATSYTYDADGNVVAAGGNTYAYDWNNELVSASVGGTASTYAYDATGLRVSAGGGVSGSYLYDRTSGIPQLVGDGTNAYLRSDTGELLSQQSGTTTTYPLTDALGSVRATTDAAGTVIGSTDYSAFGTPRVTSGIQGPIGFAGQQTDSTGLQYLLARYYDPSSGRFLSQDSLLQGGPGTQGLNRYAYAGNNPANVTDPTGHEDLIEEAVINTLIGGLTGLAIGVVICPKDQGFTGCVLRNGLIGAIGGLVGGLAAELAGDLGGLGAACISGGAGNVAATSANEILSDHMDLGEIGKQALLGCVVGGLGYGAGRAVRWFTGRTPGPVIYDRTPAEYDDLATNYSNDKALGTTPATVAERDAGLGVERNGWTDGPIVRDRSGDAEFLDNAGNRYDVKAFRSDFPNGFVPSAVVKTVQRELAAGEKVIFDTRNLNAQDIATLKQIIAAQGWTSNARGAQVFLWP
jgi:RHS repeat-associated protein/uncharacterized repeat protein (TIGR01451 family)